MNRKIIVEVRRGGGGGGGGGKSPHKFYLEIQGHDLGAFTGWALS